MLLHDITGKFHSHRFCSFGGVRSEGNIIHFPALSVCLWKLNMHARIFIIHKRTQCVCVCVERSEPGSEGGRKKVKTFPVKFIILFYVTCINYEWETKRARERHSRGKCWLSIIPIIHTQPCTHVLSQANKRNASAFFHERFLLAFFRGAMTCASNLCRES